MIRRALPVVVIALCTVTIASAGVARASGHHLSPMVTLIVQQNVSSPIVGRSVAGAATLPLRHRAGPLADTVGARARGFVKGGVIVIRSMGAPGWGVVCDQVSCVYHLPAGTLVTLRDIPTQGFTWHWWTVTPPGVHVTNRVLRVNLQAPMTVTAVYLAGARRG